MAELTSWRYNEHVPLSPTPDSLPSSRLLQVLQVYQVIVRTVTIPFRVNSPTEYLGSVIRLSRGIQHWRRAKGNLICNTFSNPHLLQFERYQARPLTHHFTRELPPRYISEADTGHVMYHENLSVALVSTMLKHLMTSATTVKEIKGAKRVTALSS